MEHSPQHFQQYRMQYKILLLRQITYLPGKELSMLEFHVMQTAVPDVNCYP